MRRDLIYKQTRSRNLKGFRITKANQGVITQANRICKNCVLPDHFARNIHLDHDQADPLGDIKRITADFNYDFLIALPIYEEFFQPYVHALFCKVQELHIPMIFYNMDDTSYKRDCYIGCDYEKSGRIAAGQKKTVNIIYIPILMKFFLSLKPKLFRRKLQVKLLNLKRNLKTLMVLLLSLSMIILTTDVRLILLQVLLLLKNRTTKYCSKFLIV